MKKLTCLFFVILCFSSFTSADLKIGAWNLQIFGDSKWEDVTARNAIAETILRWDVVLLQELRDGTEPKAVDLLLALVNELSDSAYAMALSPRLGRTSSKEEYAYFYRVAKVELQEAFTYDDSNDVFEREPFVAEFQELESDVRFSMIGIHTKPDDAPAEVDALVDVYDDSVNQLDLTDSVLLGDFNADCSYVTSSEFDDIRLWTDTSRFHWLIETGTDTTTSATDCAYDRIVVTSGLQSSAANAQVFRFDTALGLNEEEARDVSDHYPVEFDLVTEGGNSDSPDDDSGSSNALSYIFLFTSFATFILSLLEL